MKLRLILFFTALNLAVAQNFTSSQATATAGFSPFVNSVLSSLLNPAGLIRIYDWNIGLTGYYSNYSGIKMYSLGIAKRLNHLHSIGFIYSPGAVLELIFPSTLSINTGNSIIKAESQQKITYSLNYALMYAFKPLDKISVGLSTQFISQSLSETVYKVQFTDSLPFVGIATEHYKSSFLNSKVSMLYEPTPQISFAFLIENLSSKFDRGFPDKFKNLEIQSKYRAKISAGINLKNFKVGFEISSIGVVSSGVEIEAVRNLFLRSGVFLEKGTLNAISSGVGFRIGPLQLDIAYFKNTSPIWSDGKLTQEEIFASPLRDIEFNKFIRDRLLFSVSIDMSQWHEKTLRIKSVTIQDEIFPHLLDELEKKKIGYLEIENISDKTVNAKIEVNSHFVTVEADPEEIHLKPHEIKKIPILTSIGLGKPEIKERTKSFITFSVKSHINMPDEIKRVKITLRGKNDWNGNVEDLKFFLKFDEPEILSLTRRIIWERKDTLEKVDPIFRKFYQAKFIFDELSKIITYVNDPSVSVDRVQYPGETLKLHGGDCDDLVVLYASMLGSAGIDVAFVDVKAMRKTNESHVYLLFDSGIEKKYAVNLTDNEKKYIVMKNKNGIETIWIPVETTLVRNGFDKAWEIGAEQFFNDFELNLGHARGKARIIHIQN